MGSDDIRRRRIGLAHWRGKSALALSILGLIDPPELIRHAQLYAGFMEAGPPLVIDVLARTGDVVAKDAETVLANWEAIKILPK